MIHTCLRFRKCATWESWQYSYDIFRFFVFAVDESNDLLSVFFMLESTWAKRTYLQHRTRRRWYQYNVACLKRISRSHCWTFSGILLNTKLFFHTMVDMTDFFLGEIHFSGKLSSILLILPLFCLSYLWFKATYCKFVFRNCSSLYKHRSKTQGKNDSSFVASINITINPVDSATDQEEAQRDTELFNSIQIPIHQLQADSK